MKRKLALATVVAAALIGTGTVSAVAFASDDAPKQPEQRSSVQLADDEGDDDADDARDDKADDRDDDRGAEDREDREENTRETRATKITASEASEAALKAVTGTVTELSLDDEDGGLVWEVDVLGKDGAWHDITLDAGNGTVLNKHTDREDDHGQKQAAETLKGAAGSASAAAREAAEQGTVTSVDLEDEGKQAGAVWEVETVGKDGTERELAVDVATGKVTKLPSDD